MFNKLDLSKPFIGAHDNYDSDDDLTKQLRGYTLTTANILYRMPDHPGLLQQFVWQNYDLVPDFPELKHFLDFWNREIEGPIHSVQVGSKMLVSPSALRTAQFHGNLTYN